MNLNNWQLAQQGHDALLLCWWQLLLGQLYQLWSWLASNWSYLWVGLSWQKCHHNHLFSNLLKVEVLLQNFSTGFLNGVSGSVKMEDHHGSCIWKFLRLSKRHILRRKLPHPYRALANNIFWLPAHSFYW